MDAKDIVKSSYDVIAAQYVAVRNEETEDVRLLQELMARLPEGAKILDAGCGAGVPIAKLLSQRFDVIGVDFSETQIELARQAVPQARFICQDMTELNQTSRDWHTSIVTLNPSATLRIDSVSGRVVKCTNVLRSGLAFPDASFDAICSYYAIIHVPRKEHQRLLLNFHRMLKPSGFALLCMGAGDLSYGHAFTPSFLADR